MASRSIKDLVPSMRYLCETWLQRVQARGVEALVYCTWRPPEEQEAMYERGRTTPGVPCRHRGAMRPIGTCEQHPFGYVVTYARAWQSWHQVRRAWDAVPMVDGKPLWDVDVHKPLPEPWHIMLQEADTLHIEWAGRWAKFKEAYHFQVTGNKSIVEAKAECLDWEAKFGCP